MDNDQKLIHAIPFNTKKADVDISICEICHKMTEYWLNVNGVIIWRCKLCNEKLVKLGKEQLEKTLERMCDHK